MAILSIGVVLSVRAGAAPIPGLTQPLPASGSSIPATDLHPTDPPGRTGEDSFKAVESDVQADLADAPGTAIADGQPPTPQPAAAPESPAAVKDDPIPLERRQPQRILGFMPNFRSVSSGSQPHPLGWKYNFSVATHQATDYSSFIFLGLTTLTAEGMNMHPVLGKGADGFYAYAWRGFLDKSDNTYLSAFLLPSLLHEDTRFYALGTGHSIPMRTLYVISRQGVARTYGGSQTPNFAGLGGKVLAQVVSRYYYPPSATSFAVLASKFGYSVMRDVIFSGIREFYPDTAAHFVRIHRARIDARAVPQKTSAQ